MILWIVPSKKEAPPMTDLYANVNWFVGDQTGRDPDLVERYRNILIHAPILATRMMGHKDLPDLVDEMTPRLPQCFDVDVIRRSCLRTRWGIFPLVTVEEGEDIGYGSWSPAVFDYGMGGDGKYEFEPGYLVDSDGKLITFDPLNYQFGNGTHIFRSWQGEHTIEMVPRRGGALQCLSRILECPRIPEGHVVGEAGNPDLDVKYYNPFTFRFSRETSPRPNFYPVTVETEKVPRWARERPDLDWTPRNFFFFEGPKGKYKTITNDFNMI